jgi:soluble lytic murein transglycosylase-like protein
MIDLSTLDARKALAQKYATKYLLDMALVAAVCEQESSWNPWEVRYEPAFYLRYIVPMGLKDPTAATTRSMSFGLMQIMAQTAIELGFAGKWMTELCDPDAGMDFGCKKLRKCCDLHPGDVDAALLAYNGGGNSYYPAQVQARMKNYR